MRTFFVHSEFLDFSDITADMIDRHTTITNMKCLFLSDLILVQALYSLSLIHRSVLSHLQQCHALQCLIFDLYIAIFRTLECEYNPIKCSFCVLILPVLCSLPVLCTAVLPSQTLQPHSRSSTCSFDGICNLFVFCIQFLRPLQPVYF